MSENPVPFSRILLLSAFFTGLSMTGFVYEIFFGGVPPHWAMYVSHLSAISGVILILTYLVGQYRVVQRERRVFYQVLDEIADWAVVLDGGGRAVYASEGFLRLMHGRSPVVGRHWREFTSPANQVWVEAALNAIRPGTSGRYGPEEHEVETGRGSGIRRTWSVRFLRSDHLGAPIYICLHRDVTEQKAVHEAMARMDRLSAVAQLSAGMAHNFNNIFAGIILNAELAAAGGPEAERLSRRIVTGAERGAELCRKLLTVSHGEPPQLGDVDLKPFLADLVGLFEVEAARHGVDVTLEAERGLLVQADPGQLRQILLHLLFNAREAVGESGWIRVSASRRGDTGTITVSNSGPPIPPEHVPLLFLPFFSTKQGDVKGTGLGLSVSQRLAEGMGARIDLSSGPDVPTTFALTLPVAGAPGVAGAEGGSSHACADRG